MDTKEKYFEYSRENVAHTVEEFLEFDIGGLTKEQILLTNLKDIAKQYLEIEGFKKKFAEIVLKNQKELEFKNFITSPYFSIKEDHIKKEAVASNINGLNVVSVDGSSVIKKFMDIDFTFLKAIAVKYHFYKNDSANIEYFPDISGFNNYSIKGNYVNSEDNIVDIKASMDMTLMEIRLLNEVLEKGPDVDLIIIDGSIGIQPLNFQVTKDPELGRKYFCLSNEYKVLYSKCEQNRIVLVGSIKDTRSSTLTGLIKDAIQLLKPNQSFLSDFLTLPYRQIADYFCDLDLFSRLLNKSERSCVFSRKKEVESLSSCSVEPENLTENPYKFHAFYLKTALYDAPCKFEFFTSHDADLLEVSKKADLISSLLLPISSANEYYGLPIPQIEIHKRAAFKPEEINLLYNNLKRALFNNGVFLREKRRNRRPF